MVLNPAIISGLKIITGFWSSETSNLLAYVSTIFLSGS
ncbi:hypothetical protein N644_1314 [Lactiplantibacillus paraplantarum]|nr:hypothetical protein N644_1314 [Lactiplantibacillus paraplantarum]